MTPPYQIEALPVVEKDLDRLSPHIERRIAGRISALAANPRPAALIRSQANRATTAFV